MTTLSESGSDATGLCDCLTVRSPRFPVQREIRALENFLGRRFVIEQFEDVGSCSSTDALAEVQEKVQRLVK